MEMADGQQLRIFDKNFKRLLYVHIYAKPRNFIQLSLNLTKLRHVKRKCLVIFLHFTRKYRKNFNVNGINDLHKIWRYDLEHVSEVCDCEKFQY